MDYSGEETWEIVYLLDYEFTFDIRPSYGRRRETCGNPPKTAEEFLPVTPTTNIAGMPCEEIRPDKKFDVAFGNQFRRLVVSR